MYETTVKVPFYIKVLKEKKKIKKNYNNNNNKTFNNNSLIVYTYYYIEYGYFSIVFASNTDVFYYLISNILYWVPFLAK